MTNPFLPLASLASPGGGSFRNVIVPSGLWVTMSLLAALVEAASFTADFGGGGSSAPKVATVAAQTLTKARTRDGGAVRQLMYFNCTNALYERRPPRLAPARLRQHGGYDIYRCKHLWHADRGCVVRRIET
jgi:hypothetical protein